jgi:hypothetical protein
MEKAKTHVNTTPNSGPLSTYVHHFSYYSNPDPDTLQPRELEIDHRTGMKNYIANEQGGWDTSRALVRRTLEQCIQLGRQNRARGQKQDEYEAYRLLGTSVSF